jgi:hypothetical protein
VIEAAGDVQARFPDHGVRLAERGGWCNNAIMQA